MKGIVLRDWEVRGILDGRKSRITRAVKPQPDEEHKFPLGFVVDGGKNEIGKFGWGIHECGGSIHLVNPLCKIGDILFVRETYSGYDYSYGRYIVKADPETYSHIGTADDVIWRSPVTMPREVARIFLRVTAVRVERLQEINLDGMLSEGITIRPEAFNDPENVYYQARHVFIDLWNNALKKDSDKTWMHNPWVFVTEFERISKEEANEERW